MLIPLRINYFFRNEFEKELSGYSYSIKDLNEFERVYIIEDSYLLLLAIEENPVYKGLVITKKIIEEHSNNPFLDVPQEGDVFYKVHINELTYNEIGWRYNNSEFAKKMFELTGIAFLQSHIIFNKFPGFSKPYWQYDEESFLERMDKKYPELRLRERYDNAAGQHYYFIIYDFEDVSGNVFHAVSYTMSSPRSYVNKMAKNYIRTGTFCNGNTRRNYNWNFEKSIKTWIGVKRQKRIEEHLKYSVVEHDFKEFDETWRYADTLLDQANEGFFDKAEKYTYLRSSNKWITEEYTYKLVKKLYKEHNVIYQHRPLFLKSEKGGQMSYDIFISGMNIAIEYQGKQHFEPVEFFGGLEAFQSVKKRDKEKLELSIKNGIKLVYVYYWEEVSEELLKRKIED